MDICIKSQLQLHIAKTSWSKNRADCPGTQTALRSTASAYRMHAGHQLTMVCARMAPGKAGDMDTNLKKAAHSNSHSNKRAAGTTNDENKGKQASTKKNKKDVIEKPVHQSDSSEVCHPAPPAISCPLPSLPPSTCPVNHHLQSPAQTHIAHCVCAVGERRRRRVATNQGGQDAGEGGRQAGRRGG